MLIEIISPDESLFKGEVSAVVVPAIDGKLGILDNHAPLISILKQGKVKITDSTGKESLFDVNGGVIEVLKNKVIILAE